MYSSLFQKNALRRIRHSKSVPSVRSLMFLGTVAGSTPFLEGTSLGSKSLAARAVKEKTKPFHFPRPDSRRDLDLHRIGIWERKHRLTRRRDLMNPVEHLHTVSSSNASFFLLHFFFISSLLHSHLAPILSIYVKHSTGNYWTLGVAMFLL